MDLKKAKEILEPHDVFILYDEVMKMYKMFLPLSIVYITEKDMNEFDESEFKTAVAHAFIKESLFFPRITIQ